MLQFLDMVCFHFALGVRAHQLQKMDSYFPWYDQHMIFKDVQIFIGDGSWSMCKADLSTYLQHHEQSIFNFTVGHSIYFLRFHFIFISPTFTKKNLNYINLCI
jgi:hypothetical protein